MARTMTVTARKYLPLLGGGEEGVYIVARDSLITFDRYVTGEYKVRSFEILRDPLWSP